MRLRRIKEEGVYFNSHIDGHKIFMGPEESMRIQSNLASTIAMAFDECPSSVADREYIEKSVARTTRWLVRCKKEMERLNSLPDTINKHQMLLESIRAEYMKISVSNMRMRFQNWMRMDMRLADWQSVNRMKRCTGSWMQLFPIFQIVNRLI